jgi:hypothetical protein
MALHLVGFAAARVALHRSARIRGYKLLREGADLRSLLRGVCVCVDVLARSVYVLFLRLLDCGPCLPFYSF